MAIERSPLAALADAREGHTQRRSIERSVVQLLEIARNSRDADEWRLITGALADIRDGFNVFAPHRQTRKVTVFGSARTQSAEPAYALAEELAREAARRGFEVMTGAGGGVMEAANRGAGCESSIGLNVDLPFEQHANRYVNACDGRLLHFR
ncbi:MAG: LOG family protein, partial [Vulcanococcus sp.]